MPRIFILLIRFLVFVPSLAFGLTMDWSGFMRGEFYLQKSHLNRYGNYHLVLQPELQILDRLSVKSSLELLPSYHPDLFPPSSLQRRLGVFFLHKPSLGELLDTSSLALNVYQLYMDYESEFFRLRFGKAPYHFGLGVTYNEGSDSSDYWASVFNQLSVYLEYSSFYIKPILIQGGSRLLALFQAGFQQSSWKLEGFYQYDFSQSEGFFEIYGEYLKEKWDAKLSLSYPRVVDASLGVAFEGGMQISLLLPSRLELKAGMAPKTFSFHPNYTVAFLLWNRLFTNTEASKEEPLLPEGFGLKDLIYFSPSWQMEVSQNISVTPSFTIIRLLETKVSDYELDLEARYSFSKRFSVALTGGLAYTEKKSDYGLLTTAAVTF